jgi:glycine cleavage system H lipoate-binding protein
MKSTPSPNRLSQKKPECIWSQAGVIDYQGCDEIFECGTCQLDKDLRKIANRNEQLKAEGKKPTGDQAGVVYWKEKLKVLPISKQLCLHHMKGRIDFKTCTNEYNCINCDFNQYFHDQYSVHAVLKPVDMLELDGFKVPQGYYYHRGHTWAKLEENTEVRVGVDDFTLKLLGPPDRIETPLVGKEVQQGQAQIVLIRGENRVELKSPVSGIVTAVNTKLRENGALASESPYTEGWLMRVHSSDLRSEVKNLIMGEEEEELLNREIEILYKLIEIHVKPLAADGGHLIGDIFGMMPQLGWERLVKAFFA